MLISLKKITIAILMTIVTAQYTSSQIINVKPKKVKASSFHSGGYTRYIHDSNKNTAWAPKGTKSRNPKSGIGEYINFKFSKKYIFKEFKIYNGVYGYRWYKKNNRATKISLTFDGNRKIEYSLKDTQNQQTFKIPNIKSSSIRLTILDKKLGTHKKADEYTLGISDVSFYALNQLLYDIKQLPLGTSKRAYTKIIKKLSTKIYRRSKVKVDINKYKIDGHTLLAYAIKSGNYNLTLALLENGASVSSVNIGHLSKQNTNEEFADFANHVKNKRVIYQQDVNTLKSNHNFSLMELQQFSKKLSKDYYYLWDEEKKEFKELIVSKESYAYLRDLKDKVSEIISKPHNKNTLELATKFNSHNYNRLQKIDYSERKKLNEKLKQKINEILSDLTLETQSQISNWSTFSDLAALNNSYNRFKKEYKKYNNYESVKNIREAYKNQKALIIENSYDLIASKVENTNDLDFIEVMEKIYFKNINKTPKIRNLITLTNSKKTQLRSIISERRNKIISSLKYSLDSIEIKAAKLRNRAATQRVKLENKYKVKLPSHSQLATMLSNFITVKNKPTKRNKDKFVRYIEELGYIKTSKEVYSDINIFKNNRNHKITIVTTKKDIAETISLDFPKASKDMIKLYYEQFASNLRDVFKTTKDPNHYNNSTNLNKKRFTDDKTDFIYVISYENKKLNVSILSKFFLENPIVMKRLDYNKFKLTSYSSYSNIYLKKGEKIKIKATNPASKYHQPSGYKTNSNTFDKRFNHNALIAKIGDSDWFYVGKGKTITAQNSGILRFKINNKYKSIYPYIIEYSY
ncbi:MAG: hypothetical protein HWD85_05765 [Flavobacteriaceae bacterium]|nr:hypothetical protein [Flavobacteriaceae bacterium]